MLKEVMCTATTKSEEIDQLLKNFEFWKVFQIISKNYKCREKLSSPVKTKETEKLKVFGIKYEQGKVETTDNLIENQG